MEHSTVVHSRNKFIILFFIAGVIVHLIYIPFLDNAYETITACFGLASIIAWFVLDRLGVNPFTLRIFIIISYNAYIFLINLFVPDLSNLLYLIFPIILITIYNSVRINVLMTLIIGAELSILFYLYSPAYASGNGSIGVAHVLSLFFLAVLLSVLYSLKIGPEWHTIFGENKRMGTLLTSKEGYLDLFFEHAQDAIAVFSLDRKIIAVNPAFEKMYGWKKADCIGKSPRLFPLSEDIVTNERTQNVLQGKSYHFLRTKEMRKNGSIFDAELTITPIYDRDKNIIAMSFIARDITLKLQAEQLRIDTEKLKAIGEIAASVAHEVRNPMTAISGFVQIMNNDPANPYQTYTEIMASEMKRIDLIVGEFLNLSKPSVQKFTAFSIPKTIREVLTMFEPEFTDRSIRCNLQLPSEDVNLMGNEDGLKQVFINLAKNACEALVNNGIISVIVTHSEETICISIRDNGPGMDQKTIDNLFEPFFTTKDAGTGLGMMITKKIIVDHGGTLTVTSTINEGTQIEILLPLTLTT